MRGGPASDDLLGEAVYKQLLERIFTGQLSPGAPLSVPALATDLEVSRSPVRDAVQRLVAGGLAVHVPHAGARVAEISEDDVDDVFIVRELLDGRAARDAAARASAADVRSLLAMVQTQSDRLASPADPLAEARFDLDFHTAVRDLAGNAVLSDVLHQLDVRAHLYNSGLWSDQRGRELAVCEHRAIVEAIEAGDVVAADRAAAGHVAALRVRMRRLSRQNGIGS
ncbi:MAG: GntR family transcriptional regulator [Gordonia sp. (in: high G+C Gram-positive bacteria)]